MHDILLIIIGATITAILGILGYFLKPLVDPWVNKITKKKGFLLYDIREYGNYCIVAIWNPTDIDITNEEITKEFKRSFYEKKLFIEPLIYTNNKLKDILIYNNNTINLKFENFPSNSAVVFISNYDIDSLLNSGEINNNKVTTLYYHFMNKKHDIIFFILSLPIFLSINFYASKFLELKTTIVVVFICLICIVFCLLLNKYMYKQCSMPKKIKKIFDGKKSYYFDKICC